MRIRISLEVEHLGSPTLRMRIANSICVYSSYPHTASLQYNPLQYCFHIIYIYILVLHSSYAHVIKLRYIYLVSFHAGVRLYIYYSMYYTYQSFFKILHMHITTMCIFTVHSGSQCFMFILHIQPSYRIMHHAIPQGFIHIVFINTHLIYSKPFEYIIKIRDGPCPLHCNISPYTTDLYLIMQ